MLLAGSWAALRQPAVQRLDVRAGDALRKPLPRPTERAVVYTTDLGSVYAVIGASAALALLGRRRQALDVLAVGGLTWSVAQASKTSVRRQRPYEQDGVRRLIRPPTGSSFPSGHAAVGVAVMSLLAEQAGHRPSATAFHATGIYVAFSRVHVGVHYPTDVLGGMGIGLVIAALWRGPLAAGGRRLVGAAVRLAAAAFRR